MMAGAVIAISPTAASRAITRTRVLGRPVESRMCRSTRPAYVGTSGHHLNVG